jgi:hypothetical protein
VTSNHSRLKTEQAAWNSVKEEQTAALKTALLRFGRWPVLFWGLLLE